MAGGAVLLLVTGGIAAYKACSLTRLLVQAGFSVRVGMTAGAQRFVTPMTFRVLSQQPVATDLWGDGDTDPLDHIELVRAADLVVVAPATANILAKAAHGIADDLVSTLLLASERPLLLAPAMNDVMWGQPATQANLDLLRVRGARVVEPGSGFLACGTEAVGRMAEPEAIAEAVAALLAGLPARPAAAAATPAPAATRPVRPDPAWAGRRVLVTAGPTWEPIDAVRYIANRSSGVFGFAVAAEAAARGAAVTLIAGPTPLPIPPAVARCLRVETSGQMADAVREALAAGADWLFMAAAVADFAPEQVEGGKLPKESLGTSWNLALRRTEDILGDVVAPSRAPALRVVGFALETGDLLVRAAKKLRAKGMDFIVANDPTAPGSGFGD
ncbi:MAG: bifunctional phosphopantothenoylcysteine decarboxylase/phosphopantothenate synthase, partial [Candidatus Krumholzibacteriia bacterium]